MSETDRIDVILDTLDAQIRAVEAELAALKQEAHTHSPKRDSPRKRP